MSTALSQIGRIGRVVTTLVALALSFAPENSFPLRVVLDFRAVILLTDRALVFCLAVRISLALALRLIFELLSHLQNCSCELPGVSMVDLEWLQCYMWLRCRQSHSKYYYELKREWISLSSTSRYYVLLVPTLRYALRNRASCIC